MDDKVLCCCHNVTLQDVKTHIKNGVTTFDELQAITNIATDCPPCKSENEAIFKQLLLESK